MISAPRLAAILAVLVGLATTTVSAQTPAATVKDGDDNVVFQSFVEGQLLAPGTFDTGTIPATGAGTRLMWHPAKAAFRAGEVTGSQWDAPNIGDHSVAFGVDTKASDAGAVAMGEGTTASGKNAVAMGKGTKAATDYSLSAGKYNSANSGSSGDGTLFVVGNGTGPNSRSDALVLDDQGNLTVGSQGTFSDRRLKTGIESLNNGMLQKLADLRPVRYEFKNQETNPSGEQIGLMAQDVRKEFPALVREESGGYLTLTYSKLTAVLLKGLPEQQSQIESQQDRIERQRVTIDSLEHQVREIGEMEERLAALEAQRRSAAAGWVGEAPFRTFGLLLIGGLLGAGLVAVRS